MYNYWAPLHKRHPTLFKAAMVFKAVYCAVVWPMYHGFVNKFVAALVVFS